MKIFIHLGLPKTGTTSLQKIFAKCKDIHYIKDISLFTNFYDDKPILISNETLSGSALLSENIDRYKILDNIKTLFPDAKIIIGTRDTKEWGLSLYKEYIIKGNTFHYNSFEFFLPAFFMDIDKYVKKIKEDFKDVYVYTFDDIRNNFPDVVYQIMNFIGCKAPKFNDKIYRKTLTDTQINIIRFFNKTPFKNIFKRFVQTLRDI